MQQLLTDRRVLFPVLLTAVVIAIGAVLIVVLAGDGSEGSAMSAPSSSQAASGDVTIDIADFTYMPEDLTVRAGSKVTWANNDAAPHTATARGAFDTGNLRKGDTKTLTLKRAGTYAYICEFHPFMKATVTVR